MYAPRWDEGESFIDDLQKPMAADVAPRPLSDRWGRQTLDRWQKHSFLVRSLTIFLAKSERQVQMTNPGMAGYRGRQRRSRSLRS